MRLPDQFQPQATVVIGFENLQVDAELTKISAQLTNTLKNLHKEFEVQNDEEDADILKQISDNLQRLEKQDSKILEVPT